MIQMLNIRGNVVKLSILLITFLNVINNLNASEYNITLSKRQVNGCSYLTCLNGGLNFISYLFY